MLIRRRNTFGLARFSALAILCALWGGCSRDIDPASVGAHEFEESRSVASDALAVSLHVSARRMTVADRLTLLIELRRVDGRPVEWPGELRDLTEGSPFGTAGPPSDAAPWTVVASRRQAVAPGHEVMTLTLEPYLPGQKTIPAIRFGEGRGSVQTEPVTVHVESVAVPAAAQADAPAPCDPLAAIENLGPMLAPASIDVPVWRRPLAVALAGGTAALLALGLGGTWAARRFMFRRATPGSVFRRALDEIRARAGAPDSDPPRLVEDTLAALRAYLVSRRLLAPGATGPELAGALTECERVGLLGSDAAELADVIARIESARFAPTGGPSAEHAARLVEVVGRVAASVDQRTAPAGEGQA